MNNLNTQSLIQVLNTLQAGLLRLKQSKADTVEYDLFRNATVKSFELATEIAGKLLRKALKSFDYDARTIDRLVYKDVLRTAGKQGLLNFEELERWLNYREHRNLTAHTYGEKLADQTIQVLNAFEADCRALSERIQGVFDADAQQ